VRTWQQQESLQKLFAERDITKNKEIVVNCRTGREASHVYFTLKHILGYPRVRLYRGSWVNGLRTRACRLKREWSLSLFHSCFQRSAISFLLSAFCSLTTLAIHPT